MAEQGCLLSVTSRTISNLRSFATRRDCCWSSRSIPYRRKTLPLCNALSGELGIAVIAGSHIVTRRESAQQVYRDLGLTIVCDPRRNALLKEGNKSDRIDARKLAELLYLDKLRPVYHGEHGAREGRTLSSFRHRR